MKKLNGICLIVIALFCVPSLFAANRYALVIGNNDYRSIPKLTNPVNDADAVAANLRELGYEVVLKTNLDIAAMDHEIDSFFTKLKGSEESEGFFWFAGHGLSVEEKQHLLGIDVDPGSNRTISRGAYTVDELVEKFRQIKNKSNLIVIDACRNVALPGNRALGSRGLSVISDVGIRGNKIIYSTMAGKTASDGQAGAKNSPFAQAFLTNMKAEKSFENVFISIARETQRLTGGEQEPYALGYFSVEDYSINPKFSAAARQQVALNSNFSQDALQAGITIATGNLIIRTLTAGQFTISGRGLDFSQELPEMSDLSIEKINAGTYTVKMRYENGQTEEKTIFVGRDQDVAVDFSYTPVPAREIVRPSPLPSQSGSSFSTSQKVGAGFLNLLAGAGSFSMKDGWGGAMIIGGYALAAGLIIWDVAGFSYEDDMAGVPGAIGLGVAGLTAGGGFIRPFVYAGKTGSGAGKKITAYGDAKVSFKPGPGGIEALKFTYTYSY
ncbi:MAG: caspase family protein [Treponema sp.]|jgi:hypothetical protein|nr:caspase family protein [Treponema sp.]